MYGLRLKHIEFANNMEDFNMNYDRFVALRLGHLYNNDSCKKTEELYNEIETILNNYTKENDIQKGSDLEKKFKNLFEVDIESIDMNHFISSVFNIAALAGVVIGLFIDSIDIFIIKIVYSIFMTIMALYIFKGVKKLNNIYPYKKKVLSICLKVLEN